MQKLHCREVKKCGREQGGHKTKELGVCPASTEIKLHGAHGGRSAGRACWVVAGTLFGGQEQGSFAQKYHNCEKFVLSVVLMSRMKNSQNAVAGLNQPSVRLEQSG